MNDDSLGKNLAIRLDDEDDESQQSNNNDEDDLVFDLTQDEDENEKKPPKKAMHVEPSSSSSCDEHDDNDKDCDLLNLSPVFVRRSNTVSSSLSSSSSFSLAGRTTSLTSATVATTSTSSSSSLVTKQSTATATTKRKRSNTNKQTLEQEKKQKAAEREEARRMKQQKKEHEKQMRAEIKRREEQADGKFASREIGVLFAFQDDASRIAMMRGEKDKNDHSSCVEHALLEGLKEQKYLYGFISQQQHSIGNVCGGEQCICIRWVRKDLLLGGAKSAALSINGCIIVDQDDDAENNAIENKENNNNTSVTDTNSRVSANGTHDSDVQRMDIVYFLFHDPGVFLDLLERDADAEMRDDYPKIRAWLRLVRATLQTDWEQLSVDGRGGGNATTGPSRIVLMLHNVLYELNQRWNVCDTGGRGGRGRGRATASIPSGSAETPAVLINEEELHDAIAWLLMEQNVECTLTSSTDDTVEYILGVTKALSQLPYYEDATELQCVRKLKPDVDTTTPFEKAKDCWRRQLQQIPQISDAKATKLVEKYPTARALMEAYEDPSYSVEEKRAMLAPCMDDRRNHAKLSDCIYRLMTSTDPNELI
mmetsp:Transcript_27782/g.36918  ORF Transcript_27782/g.36918 Transcript_27782/m.36918 type:complete len:593 (+) Transcript_27782:77-1855(+)